MYGIYCTEARRHEAAQGLSVINAMHPECRKMHSLVPRLTVKVIELLYSKSVRDLIQWSLHLLRDPQALSSTLALLGMLQLAPLNLLHV